MKRFYTYIVCCLSALACNTLSAKEFYGYTKEHPLVIVSDWDFHPFEFLSSEGEPAGYNVEVLDLVLDRLEIPHKFVMQEWHVATKMFERHEADLIHALSFSYKSRPYVATQKYVNYYNLKVARRMDTTPLHRVADLTEGDTIMGKRNDYAMVRLQGDTNRKFAIGYCSPKDGLTGVRKGQFKYYIWGEIPLSHKVQELGLDSIVLDEIDLPAGELHIIGYDKDVIDLIDDQYTRLEQAGELLPVYDKWFHPERVHDDASPVALFILVGLLVLGFIAFLLSRLTMIRVKHAVRHSEELNHMMTQALGMGDYYVVEWNLQTGMLHNKYGNMLPEQGMTTQEYMRRMGPGESELLHRLNTSLVTENIDHFDVQVTFNQGTEEQPRWCKYDGNAIVEKEHGKPRYVVYTVRDITREREEERMNSTLGSKYMKMFDTNLVAMSFYDSQGRLLDVNRKMRELCNFKDGNEKYFTESVLFDFPNLKGVYEPGAREVMHVCQHLYVPAMGLDKYIEFRIMPVFNDKDALVYYIVTIRDITDERNMYLEQREHDRKLKEANDAISSYEARLHYLLEESNMYVWQFDLATHNINFSRTLGKVDFSINWSQYIEYMVEEERADSERNMMEIIMKGLPFNRVHHFNRTRISNDPSWYALNGLPVRNAQGQVTSYFGVARDITKLMHAQQQLKLESERAENSGRLKAAFLANMTHEIRTPLNAIVGFSGLLQVVETNEERMEFIRIIRNNCDMLLRLINDILEASDMGQSLAIRSELVDLPKVFNDICQTLQQRVEEPGVAFQTDSPYDTLPAVIDKGRLQQLLTNFVTNAVKYTHEGHIRVGYRKEMFEGKEMLYFYCEDTGAGIPKDKQAAVFERFVKLDDFVQGTGLGLSICKTIVEKVHGQIGVEGDVGVGSTFWFRVPYNK